MDQAKHQTSRLFITSVIENKKDEIEEVNAILFCIQPNDYREPLCLGVQSKTCSSLPLGAQETIGGQFKIVI